MKAWLVLDSSGERALVGFVCVESGETLSQHFTGEPRKHAEKLADLVTLALKDAGLKLAAIQGVFAGRGPGSFVGVRVAMSHAKGLAHALNIPVAGHCSLLAHVDKNLQKEVLSRSSKGVVMSDARRNEIFARPFEIREGRNFGVGEAQTLSFEDARALALRSECVVTSIDKEREAYKVLEGSHIFEVSGPSAFGAFAQARSLPFSDLRTSLVPHYGRAPDAKVPLLIKTPSAAQ